MPTTKNSFCSITKQVVRGVLGESVLSRGEWTGKSNYVWVRLPQDEGFYSYYMVQRRYGTELTGELGFSLGPYQAAELLDRPAIPLEPRRAVPGLVIPYGYRMRIGHLMQGCETWWPCSQDAEGLCADIEALVALLVRHAPRFFVEARQQLLKDLKNV